MNAVVVSGPRFLSQMIKAMGSGICLYSVIEFFRQRLDRKEVEITGSEPRFISLS